MHAMQLSGIDTNLFVVLHALLEEQSVARAARRVGLSASATSHALARLREVLADPLFVRVGRRLVATPRALALRDPIGRVVADLEQVLLAPREVDPAGLTRAFRVETTDHVQFVLLRALDVRMRSEAPGVDVYFQPLQPETFARLRRGEIDLSVGVYSSVDPDIERQKLFDDRLVAVVRRRHPALRRPVTLASFAALQHLLVAPNGSPTGLVDRVLAERGLKRRVARTSSTFLDMAFLAAESDYVVSLPESLVTPLLDRLGLTLLKVPLPLPSFAISMVWHRRSTTDAPHRWFRDAVAAAAVGTRAKGRPARKAE